MTLIWPERPTIHDGDYWAQRYAQLNDGWRPPRDDAKHGHKHSFRSCWFCGSMHPEDLYQHLSTWTPLETIKPLSGADWKYGWPHKFYVHGIPNLRAGEPCDSGSRSYPIHRCCNQEFSGHEHNACPTCGCSRFNCAVARHVTEPIPGVGPTFVHAKFYNNHLEELQPATFDALAALIERYAQIRFTLAERDGKPLLRYAAPHRGFQA